MHRHLLLALSSTLLLACGQDAADAPSAPPATEDLGEPGDGAELKGDSFGTPTGTPPGTTLSLQLEHGAFPVSGDLPNAVVYVPSRFDPSAPFGLVIYLHGWWNCAGNVIAPKNGTCRPGGARHNAYNLANQLEASNRNALLIVPELAFEQASSDPGRFVEDGLFFALVDEALSHLTDPLAGRTVWDVASIVLASHSGGYKAASGIVSVGGLQIDELYLLDSLYGLEDTFDAFIEEDPAAFTAAPPEGPTRRFACVYTKFGGTLDRCQAMATRLRELAGGGLLDDRTTATLTATQYVNGLIFKRTGLSHDDVARYYFARLLATSALPPLP